MPVHTYCLNHKKKKQRQFKILREVVQIFFVFLIHSTLVGTMDALKRLSDAPEQEQVTMENFVPMVQNVTLAATTNLTHVIPPPNVTSASVTGSFVGSQAAPHVTASVSSLLDSLPSSNNDTAAQTLANLGSKVVQHLMSSDTGKAAAAALGTTVESVNVLRNLTAPKPVP